MYDIVSFLNMIEFYISSNLFPNTIIKYMRLLSERTTKAKKTLRGMGFATTRNKNEIAEKSSLDVLLLIV